MSYIHLEIWSTGAGTVDCWSTYSSLFCSWKRSYTNLVWRNCICSYRRRIVSIKRFFIICYRYRVMLPLDASFKNTQNIWSLFNLGPQVVVCLLWNASTNFCVSVINWKHYLYFCRSLSIFSFYISTNFFPMFLNNLLKTINSNIYHTQFSV